MTALVLVLVLYGVLAAYLMLATFAASIREQVPDRSAGSFVLVGGNRLWWPDVEEPVPIRVDSAILVHNLRARPD